MRGISRDAEGPTPSVDQIPNWKAHIGDQDPMYTAIWNRPQTFQPEGELRGPPQEDGYSGLGQAIKINLFLEEGIDMNPDKGESLPVPLTDSTLVDFVKRNRAAVVDCWAAWCPPCRFLSPVIDELARERRDIAFGKLNVDENPLNPQALRHNGHPNPPIL